MPPGMPQAQGMPQAPGMPRTVPPIYGTTMEPLALDPADDATVGVRGGGDARTAQNWTGLVHTDRSRA